jgi:hypothetical protein
MTLAQVTLHEILNVFSVDVVTELSVAPTNIYVTNFRTVFRPIYPLVQCVKKLFLFAALFKNNSKCIVTELKQYSSDTHFVSRITLTFPPDNSVFTRKVMGLNLPNLEMSPNTQPYIWTMDPAVDALT